jgi:hypothetical protein
MSEMTTFLPFIFRFLLCVAFLNTAYAMFTIEAQAGTDAWRKPPSTNVFNGKCATLAQHIIQTFAETLSWQLLPP